MFEGSKILALIPARGGSKGIKHKNIFPLNGKPLIAWTIEAALGSRYIDATIISTDGQDIAEVSVRYGAEVPFMRPPELAQDTSRTIDAVLHAVKTLKAQGRSYDVLVLLQPTSPLRDSGDIDGALRTFFEHGQRGLASVSPVEEHPLLIRSIEPDGTLKPLLDMNSTCRRQDMPKYYRVNGSIYINRIEDLNEHTSFNDNPVAFVMSKEHSVDIDEMKDLYLAEFMIFQHEKE